MSGWGWKINRLRTMGPAEVVWRVRQRIQLMTEAAGMGLAHAVPSPSGAAGLRFVHAVPDPDDVDQVVAEADRLLSGTWRVFAMDDALLGFPPEWNRDPRTGVLAPQGHGKSIDYRKESLVGDIKYLWEPSRHLELVTLALAWRRTGETRYADGAAVLLDSWLSQCPYPQGVHWTSALELAVRLLNWSIAWQLLDMDGSAPGWAGPEASARRLRWVQAIYRHLHFIQGHLSRHSSANNHLFGEWMGLWIGCLQWPLWPETQRWLAAARAGLEQEARVQNAEDGVNLEQAIYYHHEVMDMMVLCDRAGQAAGMPLSEDFRARLARMADFLAALMDAGGQVPMIGDADDAQMIRVAHGPRNRPYHDLLACCALLYRRPDWARKADGGSPRARLLWSDVADTLLQQLARSADKEQPVQCFAAGGYFLLGHRWGTSEEIRSVVDCGPLGFLSIAAHGHADALAMTLSVGGHEVLIDPGTFAYHTHKVWRDHFRSTAAHNTLEVDGQDQSVIGGNFMWMQKAEAKLLRFDASSAVQSFVGEHNGYRRLGHGVVHRRSIRFDTSSDVFEIEDWVDGWGRHRLRWHWHFAENCTVRADAAGVVAGVGGWQVVMACEPSTLAWNVVSGVVDPPQGWVSRRFDHKVPSPVAVLEGEVELPYRCVTTLRIVRASAAERSVRSGTE